MDDGGSCADRAAEAQRHLEQAYAHEAAAEYEDALRKCDLAIRLTPDCAEAHNLRGIILDDLGRRVEAVAAYCEAVRLDPSSEDARENLYEAAGELSQAQGEDEEPEPAPLAAEACAEDVWPADATTVDTWAQPVERLQCPSCGALLPAGGQGATLLCEYCGSRLRIKAGSGGQRMPGLPGIEASADADGGNGLGSLQSLLVVLAVLCVGSAFFTRGPAEGLFLLAIGVALLVLASAIGPGGKEEDAPNAAGQGQIGDPQGESDRGAEEL